MAKTVIISQDELDDLRSQLRMVRKDRDMFYSLLIDVEERLEESLGITISALDDIPAYLDQALDQ